MKEQTFQEKLDSILETGETSVNRIVDKLGISKNKLFSELTKLSGYSTSGILSNHGTITKNKNE